MVEQKQCEHKRFKWTLCGGDVKSSSEGPIEDYFKTLKHFAGQVMVSDLKCVYCGKYFSIKMIYKTLLDDLSPEYKRWLEGYNLANFV
jgi:hypothetical protein